MGRPAIQLLGEGGLELVCVPPNLVLASALIQQTKQPRTTKPKRRHKQKAKRAAGTEGHVATMLESHSRETNTTDTATMKRAMIKEK